MDPAPPRAGAPKPRRPYVVIALLAIGFALFVMATGNKGAPVTPYRAPDLSRNPARWVNSAPLDPQTDRKVYLVEAWSYG
ncbi:MAG TPA: hypothetical protein VGQ83_21735 [Polyangia bacterium]|jgi:hypothetical protein